MVLNNNHSLHNFVYIVGRSYIQYVSFNMQVISIFITILETKIFFYNKLSSIWDHQFEKKKCIFLFGNLEGFILIYNFGIVNIDIFLFNLFVSSLIMNQ